MGVQASEPDGLRVLVFVGKLRRDIGEVPLAQMCLRQAIEVAMPTCVILKGGD